MPGPRDQIAICTPGNECTNYTDVGASIHHPTLLTMTYLIYITILILLSFYKYHLM